MTDAAAEAWRSWFSSWWASFWAVDDLPGLRLVVRLFDEVERGRFVRAAELRQLMSAYGITPAGRQSLRWRPPVEQEAKPPRETTGGRMTARDRMRIMGIDQPPSPNGAAS